MKSNNKVTVEFPGYCRVQRELHEDMYKQAMKRIKDLVDEVIQECYDVADQNHYEKEWVIEQFRDSFNKAKRVSK